MPKIGIAQLDDESLARYIRALRRNIEDGLRAPMNIVLLRKARQEQLARFCLRMRYGAVDNHLGTDSYDRYYRLGERPTYQLAAHMDWTNWSPRSPPHPQLGCGRTDRPMTANPTRLEARPDMTGTVHTEH
jgi:hypothetical protein